MNSPRWSPKTWAWYPIKRATSAWLIGVVALATLAAFSISEDQLVETDMLALLPALEQDPLVSQAVEQMLDDNREHVVFLLAIPAERRRARNVLATMSSAFEERLDNSGLFSADTSVASAFTTNSAANLYDYRYQLLSTAQAQSLRRRPEELIQSTLSSLYGPFGVYRAQQLTSDPFQLHSGYLSAFAPSGFDLLNTRVPVFLTDSHIHAVHAVRTRAAGFDLASQAKLLEFISSSRSWALDNRIELLATGLPLFAAEGARSARGEISLFGTISVLSILLLLIGVFRSARPVGLTIVSIGGGIACAFITTTLIFGKIHILTLVFGSSLIGISIDYSLHYLCGVFADGDWSPRDNLKRILPGITVALLTSVGAFLSFLFTPFPGLRQIAVFSATGLITAWLSVVTLYPIWAWPQPPASRPRLLRLLDVYLSVWSHVPVRVALGLLLLVVPLVFFGILRVDPNDDVRVLQSAPADMLEEGRRVRATLPQSYDSQFFLITAATPAALLAREQELAVALANLTDAGGLQNFRALSQLYPDSAAQAANYQLIKSALYDSGRVGDFFESIGLTGQAAGAHFTEFATAGSLEISLQDWVTASPGDWRNLWLGCRESTCASMVQLSGIESLSELKDIAQAIRGVAFVDEVGELSALLGRYRSVATFILIAVYAVILLALCWHFGVRPALRIIAVPLCAVLVSLAVSGWSGNVFSLFNLFALLLVVGISIDYAVFFHLSGAASRATALAVSLSAGTTIMAFGLLAFSETAVINTFGLTLAAGIGSAFLLAPLSATRITRSASE